MNYDAINSTGFDFKIFFEPKNLPGLSRNGPQECSIGRHILQEGFHF